MIKLAIITTHPIQYYAPVFRLLDERQNVSIKVFYTRGEGELDGFDHGFGKKIKWDIPLLDGYPYEWVTNTAVNPGSHHFKGIINPGLVNQINAYKPDAILVVGWAYSGHLKAIRYFKNKIPVYFRGDSTLLTETGGIKSILKSIFLKWVYRHVDYAFYNGTANKEYFKKYGLKERQLIFAPHAIDNERFKIDRALEAAELRSVLKIKEEDILILFAGKFEPVKNVGLLLSAFLNLNRANVHLLLVGNGINEQALKLQAEGSYLFNNIHFLEFKNQTYMPVLYQASDLFCLPSLSETWGLAVNEAMACSKAILVSDKCGCAIDLVQDEKNGAIFKSGSLDDLTARLKKLTESKELLTNYGKVSGSIINFFSFLNVSTAIENKLLSEE